MKIDFKSLLEWDENENRSNQKKHGISFAMAKLMVGTVIRVDHKKDYGEQRYIVTGLMMGRLHVMIVTTRTGRLRIISLRKANKREVKQYETEKIQID